MLLIDAPAEASLLGIENRHLGCVGGGPRESKSLELVNKETTRIEMQEGRRDAAHLE